MTLSKEARDALFDLEAREAFIRNRVAKSSEVERCGYVHRRLTNMRSRLAAESVGPDDALWVSIAAEVVSQLSESLVAAHNERNALVTLAATLKHERDEVRRSSCFLASNMLNVDHVKYARQQGWDCFEEVA
jgi:hypothetical protein